MTIRQQIGDKAGLCATLFNIGRIHAQNNQMQEAISMWVNSYTIARQIGYARILQELEELLPQLDMPEGVDGWEQLAQRLQNGEKIEFTEKK